MGQLIFGNNSHFHNKYVKLSYNMLWFFIVLVDIIISLHSSNSMNIFHLRNLPDWNPRKLYISSIIRSAYFIYDAVEKSQIKKHLLRHQQALFNKKNKTFASTSECWCETKRLVNCHVIHHAQNYIRKML